MAWTVSSAAARTTKTLGLRRNWISPYAVSRAAGLAQRGSRPGTDNVFARVYRHRLNLAGIADRKALEAAYSQMDDDAAVIERAVASGAPLGAVAALASAWPKLSAPHQDVVRHPLGQSGTGKVTFGKTSATQVDGTTCGAAVMAVMLMTGDPFVAAWVKTGRLFDHYVPVEVAQLHRPVDSFRTIEARWHALQRSLHAASTRGSLTAAPWPQRLGTPPWGVSAAARFAGLRFKGALIDDTDAADVRAHIAHASASLRDGIPVVLFVGGDSSHGLGATVPRHVVLLTERLEDGFHVYEPGKGAVHVLKDEQMSGGSAVLASLGNWNRLSWMVLPTPRRRG